MPFLNATKNRAMLTSPYTPLDSGFDPTLMQGFFDMPKKVAFTKEVERNSDNTWVKVEFASPFKVGAATQRYGWYRVSDWTVSTT
jgi:hypothetical protein